MGLVVNNVDKTIEALTTILGFGPFTKVKYPPDNWSDEECKKANDGQPIEYSIMFAFSVVGNLEFELIQPLSGKSIWREFLDKNGEGVHHVRFSVDEAAPVTDYLKSKGINRLVGGIGPRTGLGFVYYDPPLMH